MQATAALIPFCSYFLETLSKEDFINGLKSKNFNLKQVIVAGQKHKLLPIIFYTLNSIREEFDFPELEKLKQNRSVKFAKTKFQVSELFRVQELFNKHDIKVVPYKGFCFARQFYPNVSYRDSIDIDLAIEEQHLTTSGKLMKELGYIEAKGENDFENVKSSRGYYIDYSWLLYRDGKPVNNVEIHWQAANSALFSPLQFSDIWNDTSGLLITKKRIETFNRVQQSCLAMVHHGLVDGWGKFRHIVDLAQILKVLPEEELKELISLAIKFRFFKTLKLGTFLANSLFGVKVPSAMNEILPRSLGKDITKKIRAGELSGKWSDQPIKLWYYLRMRDSASDAIKSLYKFGKYSLKEFQFKRSK